MIKWLKKKYENIFEDGSGAMTLDYSTPGQVKISLLDFVRDIIKAYDECVPDEPQCTKTTK